MPLTGREKMRRYRERLKRENPEKYQEQLKKNLARIKSKKKKISEMNPAEAEAKRKEWRNQKRKNKQQHQRMKGTFPRDYSICLVPEPDNNLNKCNNEIKNLETKVEWYKKRIQRLQIQASKSIASFQKSLDIIKARNEVLESAMKAIFSVSASIRTGNIFNEDSKENSRVKEEPVNEECDLEYYDEYNLFKLDIETDPLEINKNVEENTREQNESAVEENNLDYKNEYDFIQEDATSLEINEEPLENTNAYLQENKLSSTENDNYEVLEQNEVLVKIKRESDSSDISIEDKPCSKEDEPQLTRTGFEKDVDDEVTLSADSPSCLTENDEPAQYPFAVPKEFKCNLCGEVYETEVHLRAHIVTCASSYTCEICDERFKKLNLLRTHILMHIGGTPYTCQVCSKTFARRADLTYHERTHTGEKPFTCTICNKSFNHGSNLRRHRKTHVP